MCESWLGPWGRLRALSHVTARQGSASRLCIADVQLHLDKRHMIGGKTTESMPKRKAIVDLFMNLFRTIWFSPQLPVLSPEKKRPDNPLVNLLSRAQREA